LDQIGSCTPVECPSIEKCEDDNLDQIGSCTLAKRLFVEKCEDDNASDDYNLTQLSSTKLVKHIKE